MNKDKKEEIIVIFILIIFLYFSAVFFVQAECTNECDLGEKRCININVEICVNSSEGCGTWGNKSSCDYGCDNGTCLSAISSTDICTDSDDGKDYSTKGITCRGKMCGIDYCKFNLLIEYYCKNRNPAYETYNCTSECKNGACINEVQYVPVCGNNITEETEECDESDLKNKSCLDFGYEAGNLSCNQCKVDSSNCTYLGECNITNISWSKETANESEEIILKVEGEKCKDKKIVFDIYEDDFFFDNELNFSLSSVFANKSAEARWNALYEKEIFTSPEYYFKVKLENSALNLKSSLLKVKKKS